MKKLMMVCVALVCATILTGCGKSHHEEVVKWMYMSEDLEEFAEKYFAPGLSEALKYNKDADAAIDQIRRKAYPAKIAEYTGDILLVGINYDKTTKTHYCQIERWHHAVKPDPS